MAIKRYLTKYKKLLRFRYPIWFEKRVKIRKFEKQKWERVKKLYYPRKLKVFPQIIPVYRAVRRYYQDRTVRAYKIYKFLLTDKQKLQTYYGVGKFRHYQLKTMARKVHSKIKTIDRGRALLYHLENRLDVLLYRLLIVNSIPHARKLIQDKRVQLNHQINTNSNYVIKPTHVISLDLFMKKRLLDIYLRTCMPYFYFRNKAKRTLLKEERKKVWEKAFFEKSIDYFLKSGAPNKKTSSRIFEEAFVKNKKNVKYIKS